MLRVKLSNKIEKSMIEADFDLNFILDVMFKSLVLEMKNKSNLMKIEDGLDINIELSVDGFEDGSLTKAELKEKVEGKIFDCVFIKKDGSERKMLATTDMKKVPEEFHPKQKEMTAEEAKIKADKEEASPYVNVFDVEKNGWRKLDPAKLISLNIVG